MMEKHIRIKLHGDIDTVVYILFFSMHPSVYAVFRLRGNSQASLATLE